MKFELIGVQTPLIRKGDDLLKVFCSALQNLKIFLFDYDIIAISSKVIALEENRIINLDSVPIHPLAESLNAESGLDIKFISLVIQESDIIFGGVPGALLTMKNGVLQANAGIDRSNTPKGTAILLPNNPDEYANLFSKRLSEYFKKKICVIVVDSATRPLRRGTTGLCLGISNPLPGVIDDRGSSDLLGNKMTITTRAIADNIATSANLVMGESNQSTPFAIVRGLPIQEWIKESNHLDMRIELDQCLYFKNFNSSPKYQKTNNL